jgi:hypothetical protein
MLRRLEPLWDNAKPSIFEHVRAHIQDGAGLAEGGDHLPDEDELKDELRWSPGAKDGVGVHHVDGATATNQVEELLKALRESGESGRGVRARHRFYLVARDDEVILTCTRRRIRAPR